MGPGTIARKTARSTLLGSGDHWSYRPSHGRSFRSRPAWQGGLGGILSHRLPLHIHTCTSPRLASHCLAKHLLTATRGRTSSHFTVRSARSNGAKRSKGSNKPNGSKGSNWPNGSPTGPRGQGAKGPSKGPRVQGSQRAQNTCCTLCRSGLSGSGERRIKRAMARSNRLSPAAAISPCCRIPA